MRSELYLYAFDVASFMLSRVEPEATHCGYKFLISKLWGLLHGSKNDDGDNDR